MPTGYQDFLDGLDESVTYWTEGAILEFTESLGRLMKAKKVNQAELARRLERSPAYVTQVLHGGANFTLKTMTKLAMALGGELHVHVAKQGVVIEWVEKTQGVGKIDVTYSGIQPSEDSLNYIGKSDTKDNEPLRTAQNG